MLQIPDIKNTKFAGGLGKKLPNKRIFFVKSKNYKKYCFRHLFVTAH